MIEILAPAGDFESLIAAVQNGANAVYIGGKCFSARQFANNFDDDEMIKAVRYCHVNSVRLYVTMNTLMDNRELIEAVKYASFLYQIGVDALIIQDIGFLKLLKEHLPDFEIHASTQMTVHNLDGVNRLYSIGVKRVVLARELSLEEIEYITKNTKAEIEVFVHGALCICVSGQCLMSSMIGGRSGNRGRCAQPCRMQYSFGDKNKKYYLSPKDLAAAEFITGIINAGVTSLKIEGRMKRPEYVAVVTNAYKKAIEGKLTDEDMQKLTQIFNRGGFTKGYFFGRQGYEMMSQDRPKNWGTYLGKVTQIKGKFAQILLDKPLNVGDGVEVFYKETGAPVSSIKLDGRNVESAAKGETAQIYLEGAKQGDIIYKSLDINLINEAEESYKGKNIRKVPVSAEFYGTTSNNMILKLINEKGVPAEVSGDVPETAIKAPTTTENIIEAFSKLGDTPFYLKDINVELDDNIRIPASKLNDLRRRAVEKLLDTLQGKKEYQNKNVTFKSTSKKTIPKIVAATGRAEIAKACTEAGCSTIFFGGDKLRINSGSFNEVFEELSGKAEIYPWYPGVVFEEYDKYKDEIADLRSKGINKALCGNLGLYTYLNELGFNVLLGREFNIFNSYACEVFENAGCTLSPELNFKQLKETISKTKSSTIITVYGREKLMINRNCIAGSSIGLGDGSCLSFCDGKIHYLKDKMGEAFPVITTKNCRSVVYNSKILCIIDSIKDIINLNANYIKLDFTYETPEDAGLVVKAFKESIQNAAEGDYKNNEYSEMLKEKLKGNITKGHFLRGVD